jgi:transcriptional regulator with PAS, ATPase and Fis domain
MSSDPGELSTHDFRWQALFQRATEPLFVLNRRRRILFVNRAWEKLTGLSAAEARGLACLRRTPSPEDPPDVVIRALCCPPPEVLHGKPGRARRLVPRSETARWWDVDFLPLCDEQGLLCVLGKITIVAPDEPSSVIPLPDKLVALREARAQRYGLEQLASSLPAFHRIVEQVRLAAQTSVPVLIVGEAGAGKQWIARTIHLQGRTREGPFAALDCARLPGALLSEVLFGSASSGTQYLREPSRLARDVQLRLCERLSAGTSGPRLIAGLRLDPAAEVQAGRLLEELACALGTVTIVLPPLRERGTDLPALVDWMLARVQTASERRVVGLTEAAWEMVRAYPWPGNLRELYSVLQSACQRTSHTQIDVDHLPAFVRLAIRLEQTGAAAPEKPLPLDQLLQEAERRLIVLAIRKARGNRSRAAELLSVWRPRLLRRIEVLGIDDLESSP